MEERKLVASEGMVFADKNGGIIGKVLYLGIYDSPENYVEIEENSINI